jgi:hypothetical protein
MITVNVKRFIELQTQINTQITQYGEADAQLAGELDLLGDQLTGDEINQLYIHFEGDEMEYEDVEDQIS